MKFLKALYEIFIVAGLACPEYGWGGAVEVQAHD